MQRTGVACLLALLAFSGSPGRTQELETPLEFSAVALSAGGPLSTPVAAQLQIVVERWSTGAERERLIEAINRGQEAALDVLARFEPVGSVRSPGDLRWAMRYAQQTPGEDGGQQIFLATDRPLSFAEAVEQPRSARYPFTAIQLDVNARGEGSGTLTQAARLRATRDGRMLMLESYTVQPVSLNQVRRR